METHCSIRRAWVPFLLNGLMVRGRRCMHPFLVGSAHSFCCVKRATRGRSQHGRRKWTRSNMQAPTQQQSHVLVRGAGAARLRARHSPTGPTTYKMHRLLFLVILCAVLVPSGAYSSWNVPKMRSSATKAGQPICMSHESSSTSRRSFLFAVGE